MKKILLIVIGTLFVSCIEKTKNSESSAEKALNEGFVFIDGYDKVIHWDESCKRAHRKVIILRDIKDLRKDVEFCSCVPVPKMKEIKERM